MAQEREVFNLVVVGHVDHGKSTVVGRLLADTHTLPEGKLEFVKENCRRNSRSFEYAFLLDALKEEQTQGITIDIARTFLKTDRRDYMIIDAPGHVEFLKNMVTGASWAEAALLVIDVSEGVRENSRRHGFLLSMLGVKQIAVLVNKMDLIGYDQQVYDQVVEEFSSFLKQIDLQATAFLPVSGREGANITVPSERMPWYRGLTLIEQIDAFAGVSLPNEKPFRMPVQDVYKFTQGGDSRRIVAGKIETGSYSLNDEVIFYPSGKKTKVNSIEAFHAAQTLTQQSAGWSTGFTLQEQIYIRRGEVATLAGQTKPHTSDRMRVNLFWLGKQPLRSGVKYRLKLNATRVGMMIESINRVIDASNLDQKEREWVERNEVAECILRLEQPVAFDLVTEIAETSRFVIVDDYEISGGGIIIGALESATQSLTEKVQTRNIHWEFPSVNEQDRAERYGQKPCLVIITGKSDNRFRKEIAKVLEKQLFLSGRFVYYIGMASLLYGIDADIKNNWRDRDDMAREYICRLGEIAYLMMDAGLILLVSTRELRSTDLKILKTILTDRVEHVFTVWAGTELSTDLQPDLHLSSAECRSGADRIIALLLEKGMIS